MSEDLNQILNKWTNPYRTSYSTFNGYMVPTPYEKLKEDIDNFQIFDDDIWICSYPKTGTTWISELVWLIVDNFDYDKATKLNTYERIRFLELSILFYTRDHPDVKVHNAVHDSINYAKNQQRPRLIKSHLPLHFLPKQIRNGEKHPKIIYITRNPGDACVSYYYHAASMGFSGTLEEFCKLYLSDKMPYGSFWDNVLPYWKIRNKPNVLFLKFEDMKKNLPSVIHKTAAFLGKSVPAEEMKNLQIHLNIESMKKNESVNGGVIWEFLKKLGTVKSPHIRSGTVGGFKKEMPEKYINLFQKWIEEKSAGTGLTF